MAPLDDDYFPQRSLHERDDAHAFLARWFGGALRGLDEPRLWAAPGRPARFRLLVLPTFAHPHAVRVEAVGAGWTSVGKRADGQGGYELGRVDRRVERALTADEANRLEHLLARLGFWSLPLQGDDEGLDGTTWVLEGASDGACHVAHRWCPEPGPFLSACEFLLELAGGFVTKPGFSGLVWTEPGASGPDSVTE
jgi:hypothetical protein